MAKAYSCWTVVHAILCCLSLPESEVWSAYKPQFVSVVVEETQLCLSGWLANPCCRHPLRYIVITESSALTKNRFTSKMNNSYIKYFLSLGCGLTHIIKCAWALTHIHTHTQTDTHTHAHRYICTFIQVHIFFEFTIWRRSGQFINTKVDKPLWLSVSHLKRSPYNFSSRW